MDWDLTFHQGEIKFGLSKVPHTEQVERDHDDRDGSDVGWGVIRLSDRNLVRWRLAWQLAQFLTNG